MDPSSFLVCLFTLCAVRLRLLLSLLLLELHVPMMHHCTCQLVDANLLLCSEAQDVNCTLRAQQKP